MENSECVLENKDFDSYHNDSSNNFSLPISVFNNCHLSALETITKYIKEEFGLSYREIAFILNRDERTIWGAYSSSREKMPEKFSGDYSKFYIPTLVIKDRSLSVLESIIEYLKDDLQLRYCQIASLLNRDCRTIWTVYYRAKKKRKMNNYGKFLA